MVVTNAGYILAIGNEPIHMTERDIQPYTRKNSQCPMSPIFYFKGINSIANQNMKRKGVIPDMVFKLGSIENHYHPFDGNDKKIQNICIFLYFEKETGGQIVLQRTKI